MRIITLVLTLIISLPSWSHHLTIKDSYIRETIPGTEISAAYMRIFNAKNSDVSLLRVTSPISSRIEIHEHTMIDGMMKMGKVEKLDVEAGSSVVLQPSGYHLMIFNLKEPLKAGTNKPLTFHFSDNSEFTISVPVTSLKNSKRSSHNHHAHH